MEPDESTDDYLASIKQDLEDARAMLGTEHPMTKEESTELFTQFLSWELATRDTIDFKKIYVDIADDLIAGLLLSQLVYWYLLPNKDGNSRLRVFKDGEWWIAKQRDEWYDEIRISAKQFDRAAEILKEKGLIACDCFRFNGLRTIHTRLVRDKFMNAWMREISRLKPPVLTKGQDRSSPKVNSGLNQRSRPLTETTAETTESIGVAASGAPTAQPSRKAREPKVKASPPVQEKNGNGTAHRAAFTALVVAYRMDMNLLTETNRGRLNSAVKRILDAGYTPMDIDAAGQYWWRDDWRGKKGGAPTDTQFFETLGKLKASRAASADRFIEEVLPT